MGHTIDFKAVFDTSPNAYLLLAADLTVLEANAVCLHIIEKQKDDVVGRNVFEVLAGATADAESQFVRMLRESYGRAILTGSPEVVPLLKNTEQRTGSTGTVSHDRYWKFSHTPILDKQGQLACIATSIVDLTSSQPAEKSAVASTALSTMEKTVTETSPMDLPAVALAGTGNSGTDTAAKSLHILFVEDNDDLRESTLQILEQLGHTVVAVGDAEKALNRLEFEAFDVLFSDLSLPKMTGAELAREVVDRYPSMRIIITSGYGRAMANTRSLNAVMLPKPYRIADLITVLG
jgi:CheY-like chemotaxis protein